MKIIKNKFLKILVITGLSFNVINVNAFSIKDLFRGTKKTNISSVTNWLERNKDDVYFGVFCSSLITLSALILVWELSKDFKKRAAKNKKLMDTCVICDESNDQCSCNLLDKVMHVFNGYGYLRIDEYVDHIHTRSYCKWKTRNIKAELSKINDINMQINFGKDNSGFLTTLHLATYYGHGPIIKWLVERMFVDMSLLDNQGLLASDYLKDQTPCYRCKKYNKYCKDDLFWEMDNLFLEQKMQIQKKLLYYVKDLKNSLNEEKKASKYIRKLTVRKIRKLIYKMSTPGFAKQLAMPDLIFIHKNFPEYITQKNIKTFYTYIVFNYTFLNDARFTKAVEFAEIQGYKDIYGRTIEQASEVYKAENKGPKINPF